MFPPELAPLFAYKRGADNAKPAKATSSESVAPVSPDTMDEVGPIIEAAGGQAAVDTWLEAKGKSMDRALEQQIVDRPDAFIQAVKKFTAELNG